MGIKKGYQLGENFLLPAVVVRLGKFVSFENRDGVASNVKYSNEALPGNYILMQEVGGEKFVCKIRSNIEDIDEVFINDFLDKKAKANVQDAFKLKIKNALEGDERFSERLDKALEEANLPRKEEREYEKKYIEGVVDEIAHSERLIKPGSLVRLPISSSEGVSIEIEGVKYPIYESLCLIQKDGVPSESGIYYISQNRHGIPLRLRTSLKDLDVYYWETNNNLISKEEFITLLNHGIRTIEAGTNFYLYCRAYDTVDEKFVGDSVFEYTREEDTKTKNEKYVAMLERFIELAKEREDFHKNVTISLPTKLQRKFISTLDKSLLSKQPMAITNILFRGDTDKETKSKWVASELESYLNDKDHLVSLYGLYSIISIYNDLESDTYGFLKNNLRASSVGMGLRDYVGFVKKIKSKDSEENAVQKKYEISYLNSDVDENGYLDI